MWVKSLRNPHVKAHLKQCAKLEYKAQVAQQTPNKWATRVNLAVNAIVTALSIWSIWEAVWSCIDVANNLRDDALKIAEQRDEIEGINQNELLPLWEEVQTESWGGVKEMLAGENMTVWLDEIKNLTLNAADPNITTADTIDRFIDNIEAAGVDETMTMQNDLIEALDSIGYKYDCLGDKIHAINTVITDCKAGDNTLENLYNEVAVVKNELNRDDCVDDDMVPYTSLEQFRTIVDAFAEHEGDWSSTCLLNSPSLSYQICNENLQGFDNNAIVENVNITDVTLEVVETILAQCPDPDITPTSISTTCTLYCLYSTVAEIAPQALLKEYQVESVIEDCPICSFEYKDVTEICKQHYCDSVNTTVIMDEVELPRPTVEYVIANNCSSKCIIYDEDVKEEICEDSECKGITSSTIADDVSYPETAVNDVISNCDTILPTCPPIDSTTIGQICLLYCLLVPTQTIAETVTVKDTRVEEVIEDCPICHYSGSEAEEICHKYYCESVNTTSIVSDVELPLPTVEYVIANECGGKCVIDDDDLKKQICEEYKCNDKSAATIAADISYPEQAVNDVIPNCDTILPDCPGIDDATKASIIQLGCSFGIPASVIAASFSLTVAEVQAILDENC
ncbi:uncharacterized protein LOC114517260 [Dendronephthya gigantea]|uniref:uncharacterized protein LOC114517260 n=1 Tax=Dendronephthya gigantea TaxID=151771 RepID=UPI00106B9A0B|nr:uncharacterized protein LOC114517260 [Dendronephthya gigantea]